MMSRFNSAHNMFACYTRSYSLTRSSAKSIRFGLASAPFLACSSCNVGLCRHMTAMLGRRYSKRVEEGGDPMEQLNSLERRQVSLKGSCRLLQTSQRQALSDAQRALVVPLVDGAIRSPGARWAPVLGVAIRGETPLLTHETERGDGRQPLKPLRR